MTDWNPQDPSTYRGENGCCLYTHASFRMFGPDVDPDEVTALLGIEPTRSHRFGEIRYKDRRFEHGMWLLDSDGLETTDAESHLEYLLDRLDAARTPVKELIASGRYWTDISCSWTSRFGHGGPIFSPQILARILDLNIPLGFDLYFADEDKVAKWDRRV